MKRVLVIDDDTTLQTLIKKVLERENFDVVATKFGKEGVEYLKNNSFNVIVLDMGLPDADGLEILSEMRSINPTIPIIIVSARDTIDDKVSGLYEGADDYLIKPFNFKELVARVKVLLRRKEKESKPTNQFGKFEVNYFKQKVHLEGKLLDVSNKEYDLLIYLLENAGKVVTYSEIAEAVWDIDFDRNTNYVNVYISYLRKKIADINSDIRFIETKRGVGFKIHASGY